MNKLVFVIGKAPSEIPFSDLLSRLALERERISALALAFRGGKKPKRKAVSKSKKVSQKDLAKIAEMTGVDLSQLMK